MTETPVKPVLILDTSAINKLVDDLDVKAITSGLRAAYVVHLTEVNIGEIAATSEPSRREIRCACPGTRTAFQRVPRLIHCIRSLSVMGHCLGSNDYIIDQLVLGFQRAPEDFAWRCVSVRDEDLEDAVARQTVSDEAAGELRQRIRPLNRKFDARHATMRSHFDSARRKWASDPPNPTELLRAFYKQSRKPFWDFAAKLYERSANKPTDEKTLRRFCDVCPPFRASVFAFCLSLYERCLRDLKEGESYRAGRIDVFSAVYLPYCEEFVTHDERQMRSLQVIVDAADLDVRVRSYQEFRSGLMGLR